MGRGYGIPSAEGESATQFASSCGLTLDPTYTAKAFAAALDRSRHSPRNVLYWHTLSAKPLDTLLAQAPALAQLPAHVRALLRPI